jgi:hypothetical protein
MLLVEETVRSSGRLFSLAQPKSRWRENPYMLLILI